jgi:hypothetical protein
MKLRCDVLLLTLGFNFNLCRYTSEPSTLGPQSTSAPKFASAGGAWVEVPDMRVTAVHGLDDAEPAMAAALRQLAAIA